MYVCACKKKNMNDWKWMLHFVQIMIIKFNVDVDLTIETITCVCGTLLRLIQFILGNVHNCTWCMNWVQKYSF